MWYASDLLFIWFGSFFKEVFLFDGMDDLWLNWMKDALLSEGVIVEKDSLQIKLDSSSFFRIDEKLSYSAAAVYLGKSVSATRGYVHRYGLHSKGGVSAAHVLKLTRLPKVQSTIASFDLSEIVTLFGVPREHQKDLWQNGLMRYDTCWYSAVDVARHRGSQLKNYFEVFDATLDFMVRDHSRCSISIEDLDALARILGT